MALFTPSEDRNKRGKRQNETGKTRNFLIYFCQDSRKKSKNRDRAKRNMYCFSRTKHGTLQKYCTKLSIDYHNLTNKHHPFPNNFQKPDPVIIGHGHFRSFSFSGGANLPYKYYINIFIHYCPIKKGNSIFETVEL